MRKKTSNQHPKLSACTSTDGFRFDFQGCTNLTLRQDLLAWHFLASLTDDVRMSLKDSIGSCGTPVRLRA